jgi:hypothetical protein
VVPASQRSKRNASDRAPLVEIGYVAGDLAGLADHLILVERRAEPVVADRLVERLVRLAARPRKRRRTAA